MKIALLSDIHGNAVALEAVVKEIEVLKIRYVFVLGDVVGYYYRPDEVLRMLAGFETTYVRGNHESMLRAARESEKDGDAIRKRYGSGISEALKRLTEKEIDMLTGLPETRLVRQGGATFMLCHGSPRDPNEYVYPDAPKEVLNACAASPADFVVMGHTHYPFVYGEGSAMVLNPGSVGQPRDKGDLASWAIVDTENSSVVFKRTLFDIKPLVAEAKKYDPNLAYLQDVLYR